MKFKSDQAQDIKNVEKLNQLFLRHMTSKKEIIEEPTPAPAAKPAAGKTPAPAAAPAVKK